MHNNNEAWSTWIIPEAGEPGEVLDAPEGAALASGQRIALLDNSKVNAHHLLTMLSERFKTELPTASVVTRKKWNASISAPSALLDQIATESDCAITAMGD